MITTFYCRRCEVEVINIPSWYVVYQLMAVKFKRLADFHQSIFKKYFTNTNTG